MGDRTASLNSVLGKVSAIFDAVSASKGGVSLHELVGATGIPKSTAARLAKQLVTTGALEECSRGYRMGMRVFELGNRGSSVYRLRDVALPFLADIYETTHETVHLGILVGTDVLYIEKVAGPRSVGVPSAVGSRVSAHCTGLGKALLAFSYPGILEAVEKAGMLPRTPYTIVDPNVLRRQLTQFRSSGVAVERDEAVIGVSCAASPILSRAGRPIAALSVTTHSRRFAPEVLGPVVRTAALALSRAAMAAGATVPLISPSRSASAIDSANRTLTVGQ